jgi:hypothetical protein
MSKNFLVVLSAMVMCLVATPAFAQFPTVVGFDGGLNDGFVGNFNFEATGGNPGGNAHNPNVAVFFPSLRTTTNQAFLGDFSIYDEVTISFEIQVDNLSDFSGNQISRPIGIQFINEDFSGPNGFAGVYYDLGIYNSSLPDWTTFSVTFDPNSTTLPADWIGFGDEDPNPILPPGVTFADILGGVSEFSITGAFPGFFFNDAFNDIRIDNITLSASGAVPEPTSGIVFLAVGFLAMSRRRR